MRAKLLLIAQPLLRCSVSSCHSLNPCHQRLLLQLDPEYEATVGLIRSGEFGYEDFFSDVLDSITHGSDYYLLANDFQSYIKAQVIIA